MKRQEIAFAAYMAVALVFGDAVHAQDSGPQLSLDRLGYIEPGSYLAGDTVAFSLNSAGGNYLMRLAGSPEIFVLYVDHGSLGGRILKYDSGETALRIAGWGGITLYTDAQPDGLPAVRTGDSAPPVPPSVSIQEVESAASDDAEHLLYARRLAVQFAAGASAITDNPATRNLAFDALENAARGIERFTASAAARDAFARRVATVSVEIALRPRIAINGKTLVVTFDPGEGLTGRASSRAIARALGTLLLPQR
jgi:hypothetical protein